MPFVFPCFTTTSEHMKNKLQGIDRLCSEQPVGERTFGTTTNDEQNNNMREHFCMSFDCSFVPTS